MELLILIWFGLVLKFRSRYSD